MLRMVAYVSDISATMAALSATAALGDKGDTAA
jgi:hypothetical protein